MARYLVRVLDTSGVAQTVFDDLDSLTLELNLNGVSNHQLILHDGDARLANFVLDAGVQVVRDAITIYDGLHRTPQRQITETGKRFYTSYGRSLEDLLQRRHIQYYADTAQTDKTGATETVMKAFVSENAGPLSTIANGRFRQVTTPIAVQASAGQGITWAGARAHDNLLEVLKELSQFGSVDFDVVRTSGVNFEFRTYYPRKGVDRRSTAGANAHIFSVAHGNMATPSYTVSRTEEIQTVVALGEGEGTLRTFVEEVGTGIADSPWNDIEFIQDSRSEENIAGLEATAIDKLAESGPQTTLAFQTLQIDASKYGVHYNVGDWITARFDDVQKDLRIVGATINIADGIETITLRCEDIVEKPPSSIDFNPISYLANAIRNINVRLTKFDRKETNKFPKIKALDFKDAADLPALPASGYTRFFPRNGDYYFLRPDGTAHGPVVLARPGQVNVALQFIIGDGQTVIPTGRHNLIDQLPFDFNITRARLQSVLGDTGSIVVDLETYTPGPAPTFTSITSATPPTITASDNSDNSTLTGWTKALSSGQGITAEVVSVSTFKEIGLILEGKRTVFGVSGQPVKARVAATGNVNIAAPGATIDTVTMVAGDRVFLPAQTNAAQNGIYIWQSAAATMARALDANEATEFHNGLLIMAEEGSQAGQMWLHTTQGAILLGTTNLTFSHLSMGTVVEELDGTPSGSIDTIKVPNGTLTIVGRTATLDYASIFSGIRSYITGPFNLPITVATTLLWSASNYDTDTYAASSSVFRVPTAGYYDIALLISFSAQATAASYYDLRMYKNGVEWAHSRINDSDPNVPAALLYHDTLQLVALDELYFTVEHGAVDTRSVGGGSAASWVAIKKVGN